MKAPDFAVCILPAGESGNALIRAARAYTGYEDDALFKTVRESAGKPYFPLLPDVQFSVTHSGDYWACAFGPACVGLDLQQHRTSDPEKLSRRFFHPDEDAFLRARGYETAAFFNIWAAKESYVKYTGEGIVRGLNTFSVVPPPQTPEIRHIPFLPGFDLCICAARIGEVTLLPMR